MAERDRPHLLVPSDRVHPEEYTPYGGGGEGSGIPTQPRARHGATLKDALDEAVEEGEQRRGDAAAALDLGEAEGIFLSFEAFPELDLALESLENRRQRRPAELVAVRTAERDGARVQLATVYMPEGVIGGLITKIEQYLTEDTPKGQPRHRNLVDRIADIRLATIEALWTEELVPFPERGTVVWWEVWLRRGDPRDEAAVVRFLAFAGAVQLEVSDRRLAFPDRTVLLVRGSAQQLASSIDVLDDMAELRAPRQLGEFFDRMAPAEQAEWIDDLVARTRVAGPDAPAVCVLDTGVRRAHPLLAPSLEPQDVHTVFPDGQTADHTGHGTEMSGLGLYGERLGDHLADAGQLVLHHRLESVRVLPPHPQQNDPELYGAITAQAVSRAEIAAPERQRAVALAITADPPATGNYPAGQPTSWSSALDALAAGRGVITTAEGITLLDEGDAGATRLIVTAAGNVDQEHWHRAHLARSDLDAVMDPAQAWNALTVGAATNLVDPGGHTGYSPVAPAGELSPHSRTSVAFQRQWPIKPDICMEGGNVAVGPDEHYDTPTSMQLLTTNGSPGTTRLLSVSNATSAATAQAARIAALVWAEYPQLWPETVRALLVHGAQWTPQMLRHFAGAQTKGAGESLVRRYGMGVPTPDRVLRSASNEVALVAEHTIHPFAETKLREMHLVDLPWPTEVLEELGGVQVRLRVTLSYFIEPNPSRRGWVGRFRYASHGLRFDVKRPTESVVTLRRRLNQQALDDDEKRPTGGSDADEWLLGANTRSRGSIHSDIWTGTAADLAARGMVAVYPVSGWWKDLPKRDRSDDGVRYALVLSIEAPQVEVDLWTPVQQQIAAAVVIT